MNKPRNDQDSMIHTRFRVLVEVASRQPSVRQADIAEKLNITPQAVSEYFKQLLHKGYLTSDGPLNYRVTKKGVEEIIKGARELKDYSRFVLERIVRDVKVFTAIADEDLKKGQRAAVWMKDGLLYAGNEGLSEARGIVICDARKDEDVGIRDLAPSKILYEIPVKLPPNR